METDEPIEVPHADKGVLGAEVVRSFADYLTDEGAKVRSVSMDELEARFGPITTAKLFDVVRGKESNASADRARDSFSQGDLGSSILLLRVQFYLDDWGNSSRGWQVANKILNAGIPGKRMVVDARLFDPDGLSELWRGLAQERVSPRASKKGLDRVVRSLGGELMESDELKEIRHE